MSAAILSVDASFRAAADPRAYELVRSARRTLEVRVLPGGRVEVRAPLHLPDRSIREFLAERAAWIERARLRWAGRAVGPRRYEDGEVFYYLGRGYPLKIVPGAYVRLRLTEVFELSADHVFCARGVFEDWYRARALRELLMRVEGVAVRMQVRPGPVRLTGARARWGSCSPDGTIRLNWRLVLAPERIIEYVIVHELAHLEHHDHSGRFWARVEKAMSDHRDAVQWLKQHGHELNV